MKPSPTFSIPAWLGLILAFLPALTMALPQIQTWQLDNGAKVYFVEAPEVPMVDTRVLFDAASSRDGTHPGLANQTIGMLNEGAGGLSATELSQTLDSLGAQLELNALRDMAYIGFRSLSDADTLASVANTVALMIQQPEFPEQAYDRVRNQTLLGLRYSKQDAASRASKRLFRELYKDHPYEFPVNGTEASVKRLTPEMSRAFHKRYLVGRNTQVVIVGALKRDQANHLANTLVGALPVGKPPKAIPEPAQPKQGHTLHLAHPGSQTHVLMGQPGMKRGDPDYFPLYVGNQILGGSGLTSILSKEIREKRGLSYSAGSQFSPMRVSGPFLIQAQTKNDQAQETATVMRQTLETFIKEGPTAAELEAIKKNLTGGFPLRIASNRQILGYLAMIAYYGLPLDYLATLNDRINAVTTDDIRDAFQRRVDPNKMLTLLVGGDEAAK